MYTLLPAEENFLKIHNSRILQCDIFNLENFNLTSKAVNRGDKRTRHVLDRVFVIFERSRRYRNRYRCQEKKSRCGRALGPVFRDPPMPRTRP
jgi:hypothetical protein